MPVSRRPRARRITPWRRSEVPCRSFSTTQSGGRSFPSVPSTHRSATAPATTPRAACRTPSRGFDYVQKLGCNGLLLGPIFSSVSHGYDTLDHFSIDSRLGTDADFDRFVSLSHERGFQIMLDGVFNHVADSHPMAGELSERDEHGNVRTWEGHGGLVNLDHSNPAVADLVTEVMLHWLRRGISGWRLDVAYDVPPEFWREVTGRVRREFPDALFLGEMIHGEYEQFVEDSTLDTVTQYRLWKAIWSSIKDVNLWELDWALKEHVALCEHFVPQTFIGNHDVERIATKVGIHGAAVAAGILLTVPGMPSIYYGDEQGFRGRKLEGFAADDELRPPLPPHRTSCSRREIGCTNCIVISSRYAGATRGSHAGCSRSWTRRMSGSSTPSRMPGRRNSFGSRPHSNQPHR